MEYYNNILCIAAPDLLSGDPPIMTKAAYDHFVNRYPHVRVRRGRTGCPALLSYKLLRGDIKQRIVERYGDVEKHIRVNQLERYIEPDYNAGKFFADYMTDDGKSLGDRQPEYIANAMVLNAVGRFVTERVGKARSISSKVTGIWNMVSDSVNSLDTVRYPHSLPSHPMRLKEKYTRYAAQGYPELIHKGRGNNNASKRTQAVDNLIVSLYCQQNIPFGEWVYDDYLQFIAGQKMIVDKDTGTIYDRDEFFDEAKGMYTVISKSTVYNIIHDPKYKAVIQKRRSNRIDHITQNCPYDHRKNPEWALSMITMDDRDLPRRTTEGKRVHVYAGADIMSEVILGVVFSQNIPTVDMVLRCFREIYHTLDDNGLMWPAELECENHLMRNIEAQLRDMFAFVSFGQPGVGRSKYMENIWRRLKYQVEKRRHQKIGRFYLKGAYKIKSDDKQEEYREAWLPYDQLVAEALEDIHIWNHSLHPNQKRFPGKTRWEVLQQNMHPDLGRPLKYKLFKNMGLVTETSIRNQDFVTVQYEKYAIDNFEALRRLKPNNYKVQACYLPARDGSIGEVYLYQDDTFISRATKIQKYQKSQLERTDEDEQIRLERSKRNSHYFALERKAMEEHVTKHIEVIDPDLVSQAPETVEIVYLPEPVDENLQLEQWLEESKRINYKEIAFQQL